MNHKYLVTLFVLSRILDTFSTILNVQKWGVDVEGNPIIAITLRDGSFIKYQMIATVLMVLFLEFVAKRISLPIYVSLTAFSLVVGLSNLLCYLLIK